MRLRMEPRRVLAWSKMGIGLPRFPVESHLVVRFYTFAGWMDGWVNALQALNKQLERHFPVRNISGVIPAFG